MPERGCKIVQVRWTPADSFETIESFGGSLEEAKRVADGYLMSRRIRGTLQWVEGEPDQNGPVHWGHLIGHGRGITIRIKQ